MRTTIDIPDPIYRQLKIKAASEGRSVKDLILSGVAVTLKAESPASKPKGKYKFPLIPSKRTDTLKLGEEGVYEYIPFP